MNNKEFIATLSRRLQTTPKESSKTLCNLTHTIAALLDDGDTLSIQGFGTFEVKKKLERIVVTPTTHERRLVPPKLVMTFKQSSVLKEKFSES